MVKDERRHETNKKLNSKPDRNKRGRPQKRKAGNKSGGQNWKSKFCNAIKVDEGFNSIMSTMATEERTNRGLFSNSQLPMPGNKALVSALLAFRI